MSNLTLYNVCGDTLLHCHPGKMQKNCYYKESSVSVNLSPNIVSREDHSILGITVGSVSDTYHG